MTFDNDKERGNTGGFAPVKSEVLAVLLERREGYKTPKSAIYKCKNDCLKILDQ